MKFFILLALISTQVFGMSRERAVYDLQYVPEKSVVFGLTDVSYENYIYDATDSSRTKRDAVQASQTVGYGFTDNFLMSLGANYLSARNSYEGSVNTNNRGVSDPVVDLKYRLQDNYFRFDVVAGWMVKTGDYEYVNEVYNNKVGGSRFNVGLNFGQKFELVQWSLLMNYFRQTEASVVERYDGVTDTSTLSAYNFYSADLSGLIFLDDKFILKGLISVIVSDPLGGHFTRSTVNRLRAGPEFQYLVTENFLLRTGAAYKTDEVTKQDGYNSGFIYNLGATYQF